MFRYLLSIILLACLYDVTIPFKPPPKFPTGDEQPRGRSGRGKGPHDHVLEIIRGLLSSNDTGFPECVKKPKYDCEDIFSSPLRTFNGRCNNQISILSGATDRSFRRLIPAVYQNDKTGALRLAANGGPLPSARVISNDVQGPRIDSRTTTQMLPFWGQFAVHDITLTLEPEASVIPCKCQGSENNPDCINIPIPVGDPQYQADLLHRRTCFPVERSVGGPDSSTCSNKVRQQFNELSAYIDMGVIYGNSEEVTKALRERASDKPGELIEIANTAYGPLLPPTDYKPRMEPADEQIFCPQFVKKPSLIDCRVSGEARTNENSMLQSNHIVWMRLHNIVAKKLKALNSNWDSDKIFETAKTIVTAMNQRVTYEHFLPTLLGDKIMQRFDLNVQSAGFWYGYDPAYNADVTNSFATAAFRMGHTLINEFLSRPNPDWQTQKAPPLRVKESLFNVGEVVSFDRSGPNPFVRGNAEDMSLVFDPTFSDDLRNFLDAPVLPHSSNRVNYGFDLLARNIQRGRDHGLAPYVKYRTFCGLTPARSFNDLRDSMDTDKILRLQEIYHDVRDIDLYAGGISERSVVGGVVGPTFACLIAYQFRDLKKGDRLYHENAPPFGPFNEAQLNNIRNIPFARILCETVADMQSIQQWPMKLVGPGNERQQCSSYPAFELPAFKDGSANAPRGRPKMKKTMWFTTRVEGANRKRPFTVGDLYQYLRRTRPTQVCDQVVQTSVKTVNNFQQVRFRCLPGTIAFSDFPPIYSVDYQWTRWFECPRGYGDHYDCVIQPETPDCKLRYDIQAQTVLGVPAGEAKQVFNKFSPSDGLVCYGRDQSKGKCNEYRVRFLCKN